MYLSVNQCDQLDIAVKSFEVAFRSYIANKIVTELNTQTLFDSKIENKNLNGSWNKIGFLIQRNSCDAI